MATKADRQVEIAQQWRQTKYMVHLIGDPEAVAFIKQAEQDIKDGTLWKHPSFEEQYVDEMKQLGLLAE